MPVCTRLASGAPRESRLLHSCWRRCLGIGPVDVLSNALGYGPLGFLITLGGLRSRLARPLLLAVGVAFCLSLVMESLQSYLPSRVPSNVDLFLNAMGGAVGAMAAWALERLGALDRWSLFRARWFVPESRGALVL